MTGKIIQGYSISVHTPDYLTPWPYVVARQEDSARPVPKYATKYDPELIPFIFRLH
jgi:hypothetical protein